MLDCKSAYTYAKDYCSERFENAFRKYLVYFDDNRIKYGTIENFKNCLMFAGCLFDTHNDELATWKIDLDNIKKTQYLFKIKFTPENTEFVDENLTRLCEILQNIDAKNANLYGKVCKESKEELNEIYRVENGL